ncbi:MAG: nitrous oxide reductase family maturation protein NosD [Flavobacteriales bacterium]|nr:nitrous oxide reductase family maturation protein NosD [Flavobacteriales bacterium]MBP9137761.1 nitrous oxide reductase family maturation protein NosD [Flavobacteriales bacterium]
MTRYFTYALGVVLFLSGLSAKATIITVSPESVRTITEAILLSLDCDTIQVSSGTYKEGTISINRPIVLIGLDWPVIDGEEKGDVLIVTASHVVIEGFVLRGTAISDMNDYAAINAIGLTDLVVRNNRIENCFFGIRLNSVLRALVERNVVTGDASVEENRRANGIHLWKCTGINIRGNRVQHHRDGIYLEFVTDSHIDYDTSAFNSRYGLHFMFSHRDSYTHNIFEENGAGVAVMFTHHVTMTDNRFHNNCGASSYALMLKEINDVEIARNTFTDNTIAILLDGCNRGQIHDNFFGNNGWGAKLFANSMDCVFETNTFTGNTFDVTTNGDLVLSTLKGNYWDRYRGYDLDRNGMGDVPYRPFGLFALVTERMPYAMVLSRSLMVQLLDQAEQLLPSLTPKALEDLTPLMKPPHG